MRSALVDQSAVNSMYFVSTQTMIITSGFKYDELALHKSKIKHRIKSKDGTATALCMHADQCCVKKCNNSIFPSSIIHN